jgi:hypothetical protein
MAAEGQFPKIAGDVLYASEVNTFNCIAGSPIYRYIGSKLQKFAGNDTLTIGSVVLSTFSGPSIFLVSSEFIGIGAGADSTPFISYNTGFFSNPSYVTSPTIYSNTRNISNVVGCTVTAVVASSGNSISLNFGAFKDANAGSIQVGNINIYGGGWGVTSSGTF